MTFPHAIAIDLEDLVQRVYELDRPDYIGLFSADRFEKDPLLAAELILAKLCGKKDVSKDVINFLSNYRSVFDYPEENFQETTPQDFYNELERIVNENFA